MLHFARNLLLTFFIRPFVWLILGLDVRGRTNLPTKGPAIIAANHNSHIDTLILISLFRASTLRSVRPVAAADHFMSTPLSSWFSERIIGIIPVRRKGRAGRDVLAGCSEALQRGEILLIFPEGTRGKAEEMNNFKAGIARLAKQFPEAPVIPVYLQGAGRVLPRGSRVIVPFNCNAIIGKAFRWTGTKASFMDRLKSTIESLQEDAPPLRWL
jgi:1-acyl-sn-glycerol-3-phosphate acyltransferase